MEQTPIAPFDLPEAQPFFLEGSKTGFLFFHGFTSTPQSVREVAHQVHATSGATVYCPLLAGHGETPAVLAKTGQADWVASAEAALETLWSRCTQVIVGGLSLGATLSLNLAARFPEKIHGVVSINGSTGLYRPEVVAPLYETKGTSFIAGIGSDIAEPGMTEVCYDRIPQITLKERFLLTNATGALLPLIRQPILIQQSRRDNVVDPKNAPRIATSVGSSEIHLLWLERSYHVATLDYDRRLIADRISEFLSQSKFGHFGTQTPA
ncbi:Thermostable monoacylglycerol lipase [Sulfitobacter indolifex]|uniref:Palmitoyl-protein thioesterase ABHD10, mitochondrial n=2 Tax=Sulfitobacter indolifex TaxID=225422 RepID=A0ABM9X8K3_9RHOB|nr:Alpha/beta hydrolase [Sulfitobacter indolifex HEL-45]UOA20018.1 Thermostable monoacylglycerol lipase [Sulfitobacter indolifex]